MSGKESGALTRLLTGQNDLPVISKSRFLVILSAVLVLVSIISLAVSGLNLSIEFTGGSAFGVENISKEWSANDVKDRLGELGIPDSIVQTVNNGEGAQISTTAITEVEGLDDVEVASELKSITGGDVSISTVGPSWGKTVTRSAVIALIVFMSLTIIYLTWRFEWKMALAAILALFHDIIVAVGIYSLFQWSVSPATITAFLTIMGYSLYDTVVVFDRVREVGEDDSFQHDWPFIVNRAINNVLVRSISMSITSLLPVVALIVIGSGLLGAATLLDLSVALAIGMALGVYSSIGLASPLLVWFKTGSLSHKRKEVVLEEHV